MLPSPRDLTIDANPKDFVRSKKDGRKHRHHAHRTKEQVIEHSDEHSDYDVNTDSIQEEDEGEHHGHEGHEGHIHDETHHGHEGYDHELTPEHGRGYARHGGDCEHQHADQHPDQHQHTDQHTDQQLPVRRQGGAKRVRHHVHRTRTHTPQEPTRGDDKRSFFSHDGREFYISDTIAKRIKSFAQGEKRPEEQERPIRIVDDAEDAVEDAVEGAVEEEGVDVTCGKGLRVNPPPSPNPSFRHPRQMDSSASVALAQGAHKARHAVNSERNSTHLEPRSKPSSMKRPRHIRQMTHTTHGSTPSSTFPSSPRSVKPDKISAHVHQGRREKSNAAREEGRVFQPEGRVSQPRRRRVEFQEQEQTQEHTTQEHTQDDPTNDHTPSVHESLLPMDDDDQRLQEGQQKKLIEDSHATLSNISGADFANARLFVMPRLDDVNKYREGAAAWLFHKYNKWKNYVANPCFSWSR